MGESDRYVEYRTQRPMRLGDDGNALVALFAINVVFFLLILLIQVSYHFSERTTGEFNGEVLRWFWLPGTFNGYIRQPWSILTYMFSESSAEIIRLIVNMVWLWGFGR